MKKLSLLLALCLILSGCNIRKDTPKPSRPESSQAEQAETPGSSSAQESSALPSSQEEAADSSSYPEEPTEPAGEYAYFPVYERVVNITVGNGFELGTIYLPSDDQLEALWPMMRFDQWEIATDLPVGGFASVFYIVQEDQVWFFDGYGEKTLVIPSYPDESGKKVCYFAPIEVINDIMSYIDTMTPDGLETR